MTGEYRISPYDTYVDEVEALHEDAVARTAAARKKLEKASNPASKLFRSIGYAIARIRVFKTSGLVGLERTPAGLDPIEQRDAEESGTDFPHTITPTF